MKYSIEIRGLLGVFCVFCVMLVLICLLCIGIDTYNYIQFKRCIAQRIAEDKLTSVCNQIL